MIANSTRNNPKLHLKYPTSHISPAYHCQHLENWFDTLFGNCHYYNSYRKLNVHEWTKWIKMYKESLFIDE